MIEGRPRLEAMRRQSHAGVAERQEQRTLRNAIHCTGVALHSGRRTTLTLRPAAADHGIVFHRTDLDVFVPARFDAVGSTLLCTVVADPQRPEATVGTVEHLMAALAGLQIDNVLVEVDGPELPVLDGSAAPFVFLLDCAGTVDQEAPRRIIEVVRSVRVEDEHGFAELRPGEEAGLTLDVSIEFAAAAIGRQSLSLALDPASFRGELAEARTFTQEAEIASLRAIGLARGGSLDNAVVVADARVLNPGGLRMRDEFVRHKMLDAVGDLALCGGALRGSFVAHRCGHALNNRVLRALFADDANWRLVGDANWRLAGGPITAWRAAA